jgi:hypothetical protein
MDVQRSGQHFDLDAFLAQPLIAHLATASTAGPRDSPLWFLWEDSCVWFVGTSDDSFPKRVGLNEQCAVGIVDFSLSSGILRHVGMRGRASVATLDQNRLHRLVTKYLGAEPHWNPAFQANVIERLDLMVRFEPDSTVARDQSYFK